MLKVGCILITLLFSFYFGLSQIEGTDRLSDSLKNDSTIDSLKKVLDSKVPDSTKANALATISFFYLEQNLDSCLSYSQRLYQISSSSKSKIIQYLGLERMGGILWRRGDAKKSVDFLLEALQIAQLMNDSARISIIYFDLGNAYRSESDDKTAVGYYLKSIKNHISNGMKGRLLMYLGEIYLAKGKFDSASFYARESYRIVKSLDQRIEHKYLSSTLNLQYGSSVNRYLPSTLNLLGKINMKLGDTSLAYEYFKMGVAAGYANDNMSALTDNNLSIARIFRLRRNLDSAYAYGTVAYKIAKKLNSPYKIEEITSFLKDLFAEHKKIDSAFRYQSIMIAAKDSILNFEKERQIQNLSFAEQQRQQDLKKSKIEFQNKIKMYAAVAGMLGLLLLAAILYRNNQQKQKAFLLLQKQTQETETQKIKAEQALDELKLVNKEIENKNRELEIESALERVRAKAMAMHDSENLSEIAAAVFDELRKLGVETIRCGIGLTANDPTTWDFWFPVTSEQGHLVNFVAKLNTKIHPLLEGKVNAYLQKEKYFSYRLAGEDIKQYYNDLAVKAGVNMPATQYEESEQIFTDYFFEDGSIYTFTREPHSDETKQILTKFSSVFSLAYRRYKDLRKAEEQAREARIEASLERVRSRAMAMHNSEDLSSVAATLFDELLKLGVETIRCGIGLATNEPGIWDTSAAVPSKEGYTINISGKIDLNFHPVMQGALQAFQQHQLFFSRRISGKEIEDYYMHLEALPDYHLPTASKYLFDQTYSGYFFEDGAIFTFTKSPPNEETKQIITKFVAVFSLAYRRYKDLKKAEEQAREAQIEASLERLRSKTLSMHTSEDVIAATETMFAELKKLGISNLRCGISNIHEDRTFDIFGGGVTDVTTENTMTGFSLFGIDEHPIWQRWFESWKNKEDVFVAYLAGQEKEEYYNNINNNHPDYISKYIVQLPDNYFQAYNFDQGAVWVNSLLQHSDQEKEVMKRFASVFSLTFRRYQDLKKAELQAQEATIEAAIEKVRGKAMAMHTSEDLSSTSAMVFSELRKLGIEPFRCGVSIVDKETRKTEIYTSSISGDGESFELTGWAALWGEPVAAKIYECWINKEDYFPVLSGEEIKLFYDHLSIGLTVPYVPDWKAGKKQYGYYLPLTVCFFYAWSESPFTDSEVKILKRFAAVIDLTFRRYNELQQSEINAREAMRQASLDRVRAEIASMRTISDLDKIIPLFWAELIKLGIHFVRCGVFIMDEKKELMHSFLSTPEGYAIASVDFQFESGKLSNIVEHWRQNKPYIEHWHDQDFDLLADILLEQKAIRSREEYLSRIPKEGIFSHCMPFLQGMLYVGNTTRLEENEINLIQSLADAFSTAYSRYEDFNRLESAKLQVENSLTELKSTQSLLIQTEKMASLGEMTAGIAHEIQNPLNFVNNFSELNSELIDELEKEADHGNLTGVISIVQHLKENESKINFHGNRAGEIVKGMLQHSRTTSGQKELTDINKLCHEYVNLAYHGLRAKDKSLKVHLETSFDPSTPKIIAIPQEIGRVVLNIINNAFYAAMEKWLQNQDGFKPFVSVSTRPLRDHVEISIADNGNGIPTRLLEKIFQPFFTTKPAGQGTGLGLSISYDIIKAHGGEITVATKEAVGTEFIIRLPI